ncbi:MULTISPECIES: hypothetical protein [Corallococcus]|uniref:hypothetical protein n=1 Tax=Corallococcus TaxID=83461 RepID=UPI0013157ED8|nr:MULTISPECIES: hypothetical protein [Corallococcus]
MSEPKKVAPKRKLTLNRETLRNIEGDALPLLDGVVGGMVAILTEGRECPTARCQTSTCV